ncbi:MAG TPA: 23S rRNA (guanosine(2251)-2'-O)-methyltransferase RlmB [Blastocatellia bacterium]|nr:23S rRNA (guanosine(2251)-2'-O)-methyltransferase RlmB [Blastocatellia bacterium]
MKTHHHIYGLSPVLEALRAGRRRIERILIAEGAHPARLNELADLARRAGIPVERRERRLLDEMTRRANHQGVVALVAAESAGKTASYTDAEEILDSPGPLPLLVLLDGIEDPHNLGAIIRSCECAGVDGVFIPEHRAAGLTETVTKTSAGAVEYMRIARVTNLVPLIDELKRRGIWVVGVEGDARASYTDFDFNVPVALVMGSEGKGIRRLVREKCDAIISIPMRGRVNSLNVSVATGVVLFEALRQRGQGSLKSEI